MPIPQRSVLRLLPARRGALLLILAGVATAAVVATVAARQDGPSPGRGPATLSGFSILTALDTDGQPGLSATEIDKAAAVLLALDKNGDGRVTADELPAGRGRFGGRGGFRGRPGGEGEGPEGRGEAAPATADDMTATYMAFDQNKDGKLTRDEVPQRMQGIFDRADANKDDVLTADEIRSVAAVQVQPQGGRRGSEGRGGRDGGRFRGRGGFGGPDPVVRVLDTNGDGALSRDEIDKTATALRTLDRNGDGIVMMQEAFGFGEGRQ